MSQKKSVLDKYPDYEATIGVEVHVQLKTASKIFCACPNQFGAQPNTQICAVCTGAPGTLPVLNRRVVEYAIMAGVATKCRINKTSEFARKHYFYPDLPKNYQITQGDKPLCESGSVVITLGDSTEKTIRINRIHMEEDAGKNIHANSLESMVDCNRAGTPLIEIVTEPDMSSSEEVRTYLMTLHSIVQYLGISDGNMEEGSFRADVNISVKLKTDKELGTRTELKNINSFKFIGQATEYEIERQIKIKQSGGMVQQETRLWDTAEHKTFCMRGKGDSHDYRYFVDPDLPLLIVDDNWVQRVSSGVPELPYDKIKRFKDEYNLTHYEASLLCGSRELADFFEEAVEKASQPKLVSNWILRDLLGYLKENKMTLRESSITPAMLAELVEEVSKGVINSSTAQEVFLEMAGTGKYPSIIIEEKNLRQIGSEDELLAVVSSVIDKHQDVVETYKGGNQRVFGFLVGQAMKLTQGKGSPQVIQRLLKKVLDS
jgi:aspartyl-tRNA(Asn)/glutamyl-tRNA(Gln) amidotransferase subunit B